MAATISLEGDVVVEDINDIPNQNFTQKLIDAGATHLYAADEDNGGTLELNLTGKAKVTFSLVGIESEFDNALEFDGTPVISEDRNGPTPNPTGTFDFETDTLFGEMFMTTVEDGVDLASLLEFTADTDNDGIVDLTFSASDDEFGVFADSSEISELKYFFLALDDNGNNIDDNHDDIIIRVTVEAVNVVPLPAGGLLLLGGLGALAAMRRRNKKA